MVGLLILGSIFLFGNPEKKRKPRASRRKQPTPAERREPTLETAAEPPSNEQAELEADGAAEGIPASQAELPIDEKPRLEAVRPAEPPKPRKPADPPPEKIITLFLLARDNHVIAGADLLQAALKTGMSFGDMNIFHRVPDGADQPAFSLANAAKPGFFDKEAWNTFETQGLAVFMTLPGPMLALDAWEAMLATARHIADILNVELQDAQHTPFTRQKEAEIREEMREFDRSRARQSFT